MQRYGPSTSKRMEHSELVAYAPVRASRVWYCGFVYFSATSALSMAHGYENFSFSPETFLSVKFSGNEAGSMHQMPSVSSSSGRPICSTSLRASLMSSAPVYVTMPAMGIERQRAPLRMT